MIGRRTALAVLLASAAAAAACLEAAGDFGPGRTLAATAVPTARCTSDSVKHVAMDVALVGDPITVTMRVNVLCANEVFPLHVVFALDASSSMRGQAEREMREVALALASRLAVDPANGRRVGVVQAGRVRTVLRLSDDQDAVTAAIKRVRAAAPDGPGTIGPPVTAVPTPGPPFTATPGSPGADETHLDRALRQGRKVLVPGRADLERDTVTEVLVLISDGNDPDGCSPALEESLDLRDDGILTVSVCVGRDCEEPCMRQLASSPRYYFKSEDTNELLELFDPVRNRLINTALRSLEIVEVPGDGVEVLPGSAVPAPAEVDPSTGALTWRTYWLPRGGYTVTYRARALHAGTMPLANSSGGRFLDNRGRPGQFRFEDLWLTALEPRVLSAPRLVPGPTPARLP